MVDGQGKDRHTDRQDSALSKLADEVLDSCRDALVSAGDLTEDQVERIMEIARESKKPKPADIESILAEEGDLP